MTGALDTEMRDLAVELIDEFGKALTLVRVSESYDPATGQTTETEAEISANATPPRDFTLARIDQTLIQSSDTVVQVAAKGLDMGTPDAPQSSDKVRFDGDTWGIVQIGKVYSGDLVAMYTLHLRK